MRPVPGSGHGNLNSTFFVSPSATITSFSIFIPPVVIVILYIPGLSIVYLRHDGLQVSLDSQGVNFDAQGFSEIWEMLVLKSDPPESPVTDTRMVAPSWSLISSGPVQSAGRETRSDGWREQLTPITAGNLGTPLNENAPDGEVIILSRNIFPSDHR